MRSLRRIPWPGWVLAAGGTLLVATALLYAVPSDHYIFLPDHARAVAPLVKVEGERPDRTGGGIFYIAVDVRKASVLERLFPDLHEGATLQPASDVLAGSGGDEAARRRAERAAMARSERYAAAVALRALGYRVRTRPDGVVLDGVFSGYPAAAVLRPNDRVLAVDGEPVAEPEDVTRALRRHKIGDVVRFRVRRNATSKEVSLRTVASPRDPRQPFVGIEIAQVFDVRLPVDVDIDLGDVGGPSAGLAFALDLMEELGRDVDRGYRVAATGEILVDGTIVQVGGLKQKAIAARRSGMDVFLVPGENAAEARRHSANVRVLPVDSFQQALRALATLRPKH